MGSSEGEESIGMSPELGHFRHALQYRILGKEEQFRRGEN